MNVGNYLRKLALTIPNTIFINDLGKRFSFQQIEALSNRFSNYLLQQNICKGNRVVLQLYNSLDFVVMYNAIVKIGAIVVPIGISLTPREINAILEDSNPGLFIRHKSLHNEDEAILSYQILVIDEMELVETETYSFINESSTHLTICELKEKDEFGILYTSGTTGKAKGILLSHGNIISNMKAAQKCYQCGISDSTILFLPISHCFGLNAILNCMIYSGTTIHIMRKFSLDHLYQILSEEKITLFFAVPFIYNLLLKKLPNNNLFNNTAYFFSAASKLALETEKAWYTQFERPIYQGYGLTETSPFSTFMPRDKYIEGSVGIPVDGVKIKIVNEKRNSLHFNTSGEIAIKGPNVMLGYYNQPETTLQSLKDGWFYSGDVGYLNSENLLFIVDRIKDMIIVKGENVYPSEVENVIMQLEYIEEVAVYGIIGEFRDELVKARIVLKQKHQTTAEAITDHCKKYLANFKIPQTIIFVESLPKSPSGKLLKRLMREEDELI